MSADNWAVCPTCLAAAEAERSDAGLAASNAYGKVPVEHFDELRAKANEPINLDLLRTFREYYEIYGADEGTVHVVYEGGCSNCGSSLKFEDARDVVRGPS